MDGAKARRILLLACAASLAPAPTGVPGAPQNLLAPLARRGTGPEDRQPSGLALAPEDLRAVALRTSLGGPYEEALSGRPPATEEAATPPDLAWLAPAPTGSVAEPALSWLLASALGALVASRGRRRFPRSLRDR